MTTETPREAKQLRFFSKMCGAIIDLSIDQSMGFKGTQKREGKISGVKRGNVNQMRQANEARRKHIHRLGWRALE